MSLHARLIEIASASPATALASAACAIAQALRADACSLFVSRGRDGLELRADSAPGLEPDTLDAVKALAEQALRELLPSSRDTATWALAAAPIAALNHTIGAIVLRRAASRPFATQEVLRVAGAASELVELVTSARLRETIEGELHAEAARDEEPPPSTSERVLQGVAASPGIAMGVGAFRNAFPRALVRRERVRGPPDAERARARDAFEKAKNDLTRLQAVAASEIGEERALVFGAHLMLLGDPMLLGLVDRALDAGRAAAIAVDEAFHEIAQRLRATHDPYVQERVDDVEDVRSRVLGHLVLDGDPASRGDHVLVSARMHPSLVVELRARGALGIASEIGGATSHGALLARALGVPAVTGIDGLTEAVLAGEMLVVDGDEGRVIVRPTAETRAEYARRVDLADRRRTEFERYRDEPPRTADDARFELLANVAFAADLEVAVANRAQGIGLYRTEFPFLVRDALPSVDEQVGVYEKAFRAFPTGIVTFRLLDLAGDKFLPSHALGGARGAFHGYRSIRILFDHPHVVRDQVQAFAIAAAGRPLRILVPMVTSVEDVVRIKQLVAAALSQPPAPRSLDPVVYGAMIETPAAVELVVDLAREVDFFSLGTNDLIQYALVVDREDPRMASERHAYHPAVLRMIRRAVDQARSAGRPIGVCGEMAARPDLAVALLAMGVDSLSVTPRRIPELKRAMAMLPIEPLRANLERVLGASTLAGVEASLRRYLGLGIASGAARLCGRIALLVTPRLVVTLSTAPSIIERRDPWPELSGSWIWPRASRCGGRRSCGASSSCSRAPRSSGR